MASLRSIAIAISGPMAVAACAANPSVRDYTRHSAPQIVRKVRCEAQQGIADVYADFFQGLENDPYAAKIAKGIKDRSIDLRSIEYKRLTPGAYAYIRYFQPTVIAYDFNLNNQEENNGSVDLNFLAAVTRGTLSIPLKAGVERTRDGTQTFTVSDTFEYLMEKIPSEYCKPVRADDEKPEFFSQDPNYLYPIIGRIGITQMVSDFASIVLFGNLAGKEGKPISMGFAQEFKTKLYGNATPKIEIVSSASFKNGTLGLTNARTDKHKVTVGFSTEVKPQFDTREDSSRTGSYISIQGDATERRALTEIDRVIRRTEGNVFKIELE